MAFTLRAVGDAWTAALTNAIYARLNTGRAGIIPTITTTGGTVAVNATTGEITGSGAITMIRVTIPSSTSYKTIHGHLRYTGGTAGTHTVKLCLGATPDTTASAYRGQGIISAATTVTGAVMAAGTSWINGYVGSRFSRRRNFTIDNLSVASNTAWTEWGTDHDTATNELTMQSGAQHLVATAYDGFQYDFTGLGTFTDFSLTIEGSQ